MPAVVLIAGISRFLGRRLAAQLAADPGIDRVIGIDTVAPAEGDRTLLGRTEFVRADIRNPLVAKVISQAGVTTVVHAALVSRGDVVGGVALRGPRASMQELNVIGTMQLLAACQRSDTVERVVLRSTTVVYGAHEGDPAVFTEDTRPHHDSPGRGFAKDAAEVESYVRGFGRRRPDVQVSVLRMAELIGPTVDNPLTRYLRLPVVPTVAGFDPRLQLLHEADAVEVLRLATVSDRPGVVNVAGDGAMSLAQLVRRAGRVRLPIPGSVLGVAGAVVGNRGAAEIAADEAGLLRFGRVVDTTRLRERFGYATRYTTEQAAASFVRGKPSLPRVAGAAIGVGSQLLGRR